jgi:hypothetical protein
VLDSEQVLGMSEIRRHGSPFSAGRRKGRLMAEEREKINRAVRRPLLVMAGLVPAIHDFLPTPKKCLPATSAGMTTE